MNEIRWPKNAKCAVVLSFDVDAESLWLSIDPNNKERPVVLSQGTYGPTIGVPRILELLEKYDLKASFYVPGYTAEKYPEIIKEVYQKGHEIGHHGYLHEKNDLLSLEQERKVLQKGLDILENLLGERPLGYRSPAWEFSTNTLDLLIEYGFIYDSSSMANDVPYKIHSKDGKDLIELPVQWILDDAPAFIYQVYPPVPPGGSRIPSPSQIYEIWSSEFDAFYDFGRCYTLTMHPFLIGRPSRIKMLEKLIQHMRSFPNIWFARAIDVANFFIKEV
jgi:peptidoglycan/xylan/chitin deacetylase (PgdA/CDA1 family)